MNYTIFCKNTGVITKTISCGNIDTLKLNIDEGNDYRAGSYDPDTHYWSGTQFAEYPTRPGPWAAWDGTSWFDPRTPAEIEAEAATSIAAQWSALRDERERLLSACDWTQVPDAPLTETHRQAWQAYRTALRNMPNTTADPANPVWPTTPKI